MTNGTVTQPTNALQQVSDDQFAMAVHQAAEILNRPEFNGRLDKAVDLVLKGAVTLQENGHASIKSGNRTYYLEPDCSCEDSKRHSLYCKHFLAARLLKRTYERLGGAARPTNGHQPPVATAQEQQAASAWNCAQAPSSCTLKWCVAGIELMLTLRDETDDALFGRIQRVLPKIEQKMELQRQEHAARKAANGNGDGTEKPKAAVAGDDEHWCYEHDVPLKRFSKNGQTWYSHQVGKRDDGSTIWCRGR